MDIQYLFHYYEDSNGPFKNLSSLPLDEAKAVMKAIKAKGAFLLVNGQRTIWKFDLI